MKRLVIGAAVAGGAAFAFRRLASKARKMRDHCRELMAGRQKPTPTVASAVGPEEHEHTKNGGDHRVNQRIEAEARAGH
jgi:hypothetical protein